MSKITIFILYNSEARPTSFTERSEVGTEGDSTEGEM